MTTATTAKPLPPHTPRLGGGGHRCPCPPCRALDNAYEKRRRLLNATGRSLTIDATETVEHLRNLLAAGTSQSQISEAAGIGRTQIHYLLTGHSKAIGRSRAARILALSPRPVGYVIIDATGTRRRLHALIAAGHRFADIADAAGLGPTLVSDIVRVRNDKVRVATAEAVARVYKQLSMTTGGSVRNINRARRDGWAIPAAWEGIDIDDPDAFPDFTGHCGTIRGYRLHHDEGIPYCDPCRAAKAEQGRERREQRAGVRATKQRQELAA